MSTPAPRGSVTARALDPTLLTTFLAVHRAGRISGASKALHLSQPAVTCVIPGIYEFTYVDTASGTSCNVGLSKNSAQLTTAVQSIAAASRLGYMHTPGAGLYGALTGSFRASLGDVVRCHTDAAPNVITTLVSLTLRKVAD